MKIPSSEVLITYLAILSLGLLSCNPNPVAKRSKTTITSKEKIDSLKVKNDTIENSSVSNSPSNIFGTWVSEGDASWKLVFEKGDICYQYYDAKLSEKDMFSFSNNAPDCTVGSIIKNNEEILYLVLTNIGDKSRLCYEVNGVSKDNLSLTEVTSGTTFVFRRLF